MAGYEQDIGADVGTEVLYKHGIKVNLYAVDAVNGSIEDTAYLIGMQHGAAAPVGWEGGYMFGTVQGWWPMSSNATLIGVNLPNFYSNGPAVAAAVGLDLTPVQFSDSGVKLPGVRDRKNRND